MQNHKSKYPCPYGECRKDTTTGRWTKGPDRTVENLTEHQQAWVEKTGGGKSKKARDQLMQFKNVEHHPVLRPGRILELAPPPGLHTVLIGATNEILDGLDRARVPGLDWRLQPQLVGSPLYLVKEGYNGGQFEGKGYCWLIMNTNSINALCWIRPLFNRHAGLDGRLGKIAHFLCFER